MSYYRNYRRPYRRYSNGYRKGYSKPFDPIKGFFSLGLAFVLLSSLSTVGTGNFSTVITRMIWYTVLFFGAVFVIKKMKGSWRDMNLKISTLGSSDLTDEREIARLNNEKHGCKCYMDGLNDGEQEIAHVLSGGLGYKDYFIFNNLTIPSDVNGSSQIDHLVVSRFGIFVIESKDYKGWIFGSKDNDQWTQSLPGRNNKFHFQNPLRQNWSHIMALRKLMPFISEDAFKNIVVFTDSSEIKTESIENVIHPGALVRYISSFAEGKISEENLQLAIGKLSYTCQVADISPEKHIENLQLNHRS